MGGMNRILRRKFAILFSVVAVFAQIGDPTITSQPRGISVSVGAKATFRVTATGTQPLQYQWLFNETPLEGSTNSTLNLTNVSASQSGGYSVIVSNAVSPLTSQAAVLDVDPTFIKITTGPIATEGGNSSGSAWGDYDNDGWPDLFVGNNPTKCVLYRNQGDGTFVKMTNALPVKESAYGVTWGDVDNDGNLDLFLAN